MKEHITNDGYTELSVRWTGNNTDEIRQMLLKSFSVVFFYRIDESGRIQISWPTSETLINIGDYAVLVIGKIVGTSFCLSANDKWLESNLKEVNK